jgi:hypothetical protein
MCKQGGRTALIWAASQGYTATVLILIKAKANLNLQTTVGRCVFVCIGLCVRIGTNGGRAYHCILKQLLNVIIVCSAFYLA